MKDAGIADHEITSRGPGRDDIARIINGTLSAERVGVAIDAADDIVWQLVAKAPDRRHVAIHRRADRAVAVAAKFPRITTENVSGPVGVVISGRSGTATLSCLDDLRITDRPPLLFRCTDAQTDTETLQAQGYALCSLEAFGRGRRPLTLAQLTAHLASGPVLVGAFVPRRFERPRVFAARLIALIRNPVPMARALVNEIRNRLPR